MAGERDALRDWHRLFGLVLTDFFSDSPVTVEVERDLSEQRQFLDVVIVRRGSGPMPERLPDGLDDLADHNLITFKSHHEALDAWAMKELIGHYVAYRKLVSPTTSQLIAEDRFRLYAVCARFPRGLAAQAPWHERCPGVYHCQWGTDAIRVVVAGQLPRDAHNAPLHLFSAAPELVGFGQRTYRRRSESTSLLLGKLFDRLRGEGVAMAYTMADFKRDVFQEYFKEMSPQEREEFVRSLSSAERRQFIQSLPPEEFLASLSPEQIRQYLERLTAAEQPAPRKPRRKK